MSAKPKKTVHKKKHADEREPGVHQEPVPVLLFVILLLLAFWGMMYLHTNAGGFNRYVYGPFESYAMVSDVQPGSSDDPMKRGADVYKSICLPCHQSSGLGAPGQFPPLAGSDWVNVEGPNRMLRIVINGLSGPVEVNGQSWSGAMPGFGDVIASDEDLAAVITYVRNSWGNEASVCTPEEAALVLSESADRGLPWSSPELLNLSVEVQ